ncbi:hypothetical protein Pint_06896 [Pistacia integerrima]|uniref:Uncharacterized protein n=1 Tax=Pistacia integerrima TaxID=434235 RepID=A0ACC0XYU0_9ROSI|nr:hypothetical protein Pint_06896 [Pistacia integerrima]
MKLRRDSNTSGQVKYVVELARALANTKGVHRVDLLTRQIASPEVDSSNGKPIEMLSCPVDGSGSCGAYIIRIPCGARDNSRLWRLERANGADEHSLGRNKFKQLLKRGRLPKDINATYKIIRRIEAEEMGLDAAEMVVIPPGMDFSYVTTQDSLEGDADLKSLLSSDGDNKRYLPPIRSEIMKIFTNPHKPTILALSRLDPKKNVTTLLKAFGECRPLQEPANMVEIVFHFNDLSSVVLTTVLKLINKYDLYDQVAYPKHHKQSEVLEIYHLAAKTKNMELRLMTLQSTWMRAVPDASLTAKNQEPIGDTDYENLLAGLQKTVIVRGTVDCGSEKLLHGEESSKREDSVPQDSPNIAHVEGSYEAQDISAALKVLKIK